MVYDIISSLLVLTEKLAFFNKQLQGCIISSIMIKKTVKKVICNETSFTKMKLLARVNIVIYNL